MANALNGLPAGERIAAFSYGSGFGAELVSLVAGPLAKAGDWVVDIEKDLSMRREVDAQGYVRLRSAPVLARA